MDLKCKAANRKHRLKLFKSVHPLVGPSVLPSITLVVSIENMFDMFDLFVSYKLNVMSQTRDHKNYR